MNEKMKKLIREALKIAGEDSVRDGVFATAVSMLLDGDRNLGFYLTVFDAKDPANDYCRKTAFWGESDQVATALGMEMIDDDYVRYILNNAKGLLDLFNQDLPEEEKLK